MMATKPWLRQTVDKIDTSSVATERHNLEEDHRKQLESARVLQESILVRLAELEQLRLRENWVSNSWEASHLQERLDEARVLENQILEAAYGIAQPIEREDVRIQLELLGFKNVSEGFLDEFIAHLLDQTKGLGSVDERNFEDKSPIASTFPKLFLFGASIDGAAFPIPLVPLTRTVEK